MPKAPGISLGKLLKVLPKKEIGNLSQSLGKWFGNLFVQGVCYTDFNTGAVFGLKSSNGWLLTGVDVEGVGYTSASKPEHFECWKEEFKKQFSSSKYWILESQEYFNKYVALFFIEELASELKNESKKFIKWDLINKKFIENNDTMNMQKMFVSGLINKYPAAKEIIKDNIIGIEKKPFNDLISRLADYYNIEKSKVQHFKNTDKTIGKSLKNWLENYDQSSLLYWFNFTLQDTEFRDGFPMEMRGLLQKLIEATQKQKIYSNLMYK